jgi:hypothetical protein
MMQLQSRSVRLIVRSLASGSTWLLAPGLAPTDFGQYVRASCVIVAEQPALSHFTTWLRLPEGPGFAGETH